MTDSLEHTLERISAKGIDQYLNRINRGLEKESLRVDTSGLLAQTPHPEALGSTLTHPSITTDYSESLLEFVTGVHTDIPALLNELQDIHHFTYQHIGDEKLWVNSMPCIVESAEKIPIARYGSSNVAKMKEVYRLGLSYRYGSLMQTIAGIHYNFSLPDEFWPEYHAIANAEAVQERKSASYFALIRNFHRNAWIGAYLFGASPAVCRSFLRGREHMLTNFDAHSFYAPNATSLRLSGLGYSNEAQTDIDIRYNDVDDFIRSLRRAIQTSHPPYEQIGVKVDGEYRQLNSNILQIENEFYSSIRPKRVAASGESPSSALRDRGVEYVEVRSIDLNPFEPIGIHEDCVRFFDMFLLYALFSPSPEMSPEEFQVTRDNQKGIVMNGRDPGQTILWDGVEIPALNRMKTVLDEMHVVAQLLDGVNGGNAYQKTLAKQHRKVEDSNLTPSARIITRMLDNDLSFYEFAMQAAEQSEEFFKQRSMDAGMIAKYEELAAESHARREEIERSDNVDFDTFLADYFQRQNA